MAVPWGLAEEVAQSGDGLGQQGAHAGLLIGGMPRRVFGDRAPVADLTGELAHPFRHWGAARRAMVSRRRIRGLLRWHWHGSGPCFAAAAGSGQDRSGREPPSGERRAAWFCYISAGRVSLGSPRTRGDHR